MIKPILVRYCKYVRKALPMLLALYFRKRCQITTFQGYDLKAFRIVAKALRPFEPFT